MKPAEINRKSLEVVETMKRSKGTRPFIEWPDYLHDGAQEIATLTTIARAHQFEFEPVMAALERLAKLEDWDHPFVVADDQATPHGSTRFNWKDSPAKRFKDFAEFYSTELEPAWGPWANLQEVWRKVVSGEIREADARRQIVAEARQHPVGKPGRPKKDDGENVKNLNIRRGPTVAYLLARLAAYHPEILAAFERGEYRSARAAAIAAGIVKVKTPLAHLRRWWKKASVEERTRFRIEMLGEEGRDQT